MTAPADPQGAVLVGVDGSSDGVEAVTWAAHEAARSGVPLRIVHASPWSMLAEEPRRVDRAWDEVGLGRRARRILDAAARHAREVEPEHRGGCRAGLRGRAGRARPAPAAARRPSSSVGGASGPQGTRHVGSAAAVLAEQVDAPVVVCGYDAQHSQLGGHDGPVVVGVDNPARGRLLGRPAPPARHGVRARRPAVRPAPRRARLERRRLGPGRPAGGVHDGLADRRQGRRGGAGGPPG